ncbi:MAG: type III-B CRISPR module RAMP protein Cmr4 [Chloroflexi bacterium]|nr:type III-B CRISPR module RAMP protein Cmr4 [Chloroflexota bacterium]
MFEASSLLYLYVETPLHAGSGRGLASVDLPIQRERVTGYPLVQATGIKGKLRDEAYRWQPFVQLKTKYKPLYEAEIRNDLQKSGKQMKPEEIEREAENRARQKAAQELGLETVFGPESTRAEEHAGALAPADARLLLFPVRSLAGIFAWTTSCDALARFFRDATVAGQSLKVQRNNQEVPLTLPAEPKADEAWVSGNVVIAGGKVVLEEFSFAPTEKQEVKDIGQWLADNALPDRPEYAYWKAKLPMGLVVLPENAFRDFTLYATEVVTRVRLDDERKTVAKGALWTEESLPSDTLLYAPLHASRARSYDKQGNQTPGVPADWYASGGAAKILGFVQNLSPKRMQLGGDETVGRGMVCLRFGR